VLQLAEAADGFLARVRLPGGLLSGDQLAALARLADNLGDGRVTLTSRGNVQLRGLAADAADMLTGELTETGLLPSLTHDQVRNVLASPLAGLDGGPDLTEIVRGLDAALCARPRLAELPGRFLFAIDDGRGDVAGLGADVVATMRPGGAEVNGLAVRADPRADLPDIDILTGTAGHGVPGGLRDAIVAAMLACAEAFLDLRAEAESTAWRIADLADGPGRVQAAAAARLGLGTARQESAVAAAARPVGLITWRRARDDAESPPYVPDNSGSSAVLIAALGRLTSAQLTWVAEQISARHARITPWRSIVLPGLSDATGVLRAAAGLGFGVDDASPWLRVTACAGRPGCASALADVQADAGAFAARWPGRLVHVSGCARHCGRPAATEIDVTATSEGYHVAGV